MAPLSLSAKASTSRLTRLSGLSHGTKPSKCSVLQPFKIASVVLVVLAINSVVLMKSDFDETFNMVQHCKDPFPLETNFTYMLLCLFWRSLTEIENLFLKAKA